MKTIEYFQKRMGDILKNNNCEDFVLYGDLAIMLNDFEIELKSKLAETKKALDTILEFVERWNKGDQEKEVADAVAEIESYLEYEEEKGN